jgi:hypothetical protein
MPNTSVKSTLFTGNMHCRGLLNHSGGSYDQASQQDECDADSFQAGITQLLGVAATPDVLNPHIAGNYIISSGAVDPVTLGLPFVGGPSTIQSNGAIGGDDNMTINIWSDTAFAHTVTLPSAGYATGAGMKTIATFAAQRGAGMTLRAWNGTWQIIASIGITFS